VRTWAATPMLQLTQSLGVGDLYRIYVRAQRDQGPGYHAAWIGSDFDAAWRAGTIRATYIALFDYGYATGVSGRSLALRTPRSRVLRYRGKGVPRGGHRKVASYPRWTLGSSRRWTAPGR